MSFFAEDVHRLASTGVDRRIYVWRIDEGPDAENKPQITGKIEVAIQIIGDAEAYHPRICWHSHKQIRHYLRNICHLQVHFASQLTNGVACLSYMNFFFVGIRNCVLRIDTTKVGRGRDFNAEEPIKCHLNELIDGVCLVGRHDGDVKDLSIS